MHARCPDVQNTSLGGGQPSVEPCVGNGQAPLRGSGQNGRAPIDRANKETYASVFSGNRTPSDDSWLTYIEPPVGNLVLEVDEIDTVEQAFGYCLIGFVMGPRPSRYAMNNYVKKWDNDVKITFKENGWIRFQFPCVEARDRVFNGGPYLIFGKQLFLKHLPSCFMYSKEDMAVFPSWVQIFGLPSDCWTVKALSKIASVVGKPLHTDRLTISKDGASFARVLVEINAQKERVREYSVVLPTGKITSISFKYEFDPKLCEKCDCLGHSEEDCGMDHVRYRRKVPPRRPVNTQVEQDGQPETSSSSVPIDPVAGLSPVLREEFPVVIESKKTLYADLLKPHPESARGGHHTQQKGNVCSPIEREATPLREDVHLPIDKVSSEKTNDTVDGENPDKREIEVTISGEDDGKHPTHNESADTVDGENPGIRETEDTISGEDDGTHPTHDEYVDMDTDDLLDNLSYVLSQGWRTVKGKKRNKKKNKSQLKEEGPKSGWNEDMGRFFEDMGGTS